MRRAPRFVRAHPHARRRRFGVAIPEILHPVPAKELREAISPRPILSFNRCFSPFESGDLGHCQILADIDSIMPPSEAFSFCGGPLRRP
jgi:hypothetical protein